MDANIDLEKEKDKKNNRMVLLILGVATVLIALIGATFAYFTAIVSHVNAPQSVTVTTVEVQGVVYTATDVLTLLNAVPDNERKDEKQFSIHNPNSAALIVYSLILKQDLNEFTLEKDENNEIVLDEDNDPISARQLILTLSGGQMSGAQQYDLTNGENTGDITLLENVRLSSGSTDNYTVTIQFLDIDRQQDYNQKKSFVGHIDVTQKIETQTVTP